jgi:hypothetical protein
MKILGSGIDVTILALVNAGSYNGIRVENSLYHAIGGPYNMEADYFEVSDLTIDCNLGGQPASPNLEYAHLACGAIGVNGSYIRIRRVKTIHWGTQTEKSECFVMVACSAHPDLPEKVNPIIEDCICVQPNEHNRRETSVLHMGGSERGADHTMLFSRGPILRRNFVDCAFTGGRSSFPITAQSTSWVNGTGTFVGTRPHNRKKDDYVAITNPAELPLNKWNGLFKITRIEFTPPNPNKFEFAMPDPGADLHTKILCGAGFQALSMGMCRGGIVEDNRVFNTWIAGPYQDTYSTRDIVVRRNYYRNVATGHYYLMGGLSDIAGLSVLTHSGLEALATTDANPHTLIKGGRVRITQASPSHYNGFFEITDVPQANQFKYNMTSDPGSDSSPGAKVQRVWGADKIVVEDNVVELSDLFSWEWGAPGAGVQIFDSITGAALIAPPPPFVHGEIVVRNNVVCHVDGALNPNFVAGGVQIASAKKVIVENNVIDVVPTNSLVTYRCGTAHFFNNRTSAGLLIRGYNNDMAKQFDELETRISDAFLMAF